MRLLIPFLLAGHFLAAQSIDGIQLQDLNAPYIQIYIARIPLSPKLTVGVDYGQSRKRTDQFPTVKDERGEYLKFNTPIHALNFFFDYGYDVVEAYSDPGNANESYIYLLRKVYYIVDD